MLTTETEARKKWCPMVRTARREEIHPDEGGAVVVAGCNTDAMGGIRVPNSCRCVASDCAMWRHQRPRTMSDPTDLGYCGLAGRPEP